MSRTFAWTSFLDSLAHPLGRPHHTGHRAGIRDEVLPVRQAGLLRHATYAKPAAGLGQLGEAGRVGVRRGVPAASGYAVDLPEELQNLLLGGGLVRDACHLPARAVLPHWQSRNL